MVTENVNPRRSRKLITEYQRLMCLVDAGMIRIGRSAARDVARRIEDQGGFWGPPKEVRR